jgi:azurin
MAHPRALASLAALALALYAAPGLAATCPLSIEADDLIQFNRPRLEFGPDCDEIELTLRHVGKQPATVMAHNWVLVRSADLGAVANAGLRAGRAQNYQPPGDPRVIAATPLIGGGESVTVRFATAALKRGESYAFFCSTPGHNVTMRGAFVVGATAGQLASQTPR